MGSVRNQIQEIVDQGDLSISAIARSSGFSPTALSSYLKGKYPGSNKRIEQALRAFLKRLEKRENRVEFEFVQTTVSNKVFEVADIVYNQSVMGVICGEPGIGKTIALKRYTEEYPSVILIEVDLCYTSSFLFSEIYKKLGLRQGRNLSDMVSGIVKKLKGSGRMIIIDEAEHLPYKALELLRRVHDKAGMGVLLVGLPRLIHKIMEGRGEYQQLYSRIEVYTLLNKLHPSDTKRIVESVIPSSNGVWEHFHKLSRQNTGLLLKLLSHSIRVARINNAPIDKYLIEETAKALVF